MKNCKKFQNGNVKVKHYLNSDWNKRSWATWPGFFVCLFLIQAIIWNRKVSLFQTVTLKCGGFCFDYPNCNIKKYALKLTFSHRKFLFQQSHIFQEENFSTCFTCLPGNMKLSKTSILLKFFQHESCCNFSVETFKMFCWWREFGHETEQCLL